MIIAVMQPYFLPYIGYWQLIHAVDKFIILDDVRYIKSGWINRNRILVNGVPTYLTIPIHKASQNRLICDTQRAQSPAWCDKVLKTVSLAYWHAPYLGEVFPVFARIVQDETANLADCLTRQLTSLLSFMGIGTELVVSSRRYANHHLSGEARIIDICRQERATEYLNLPGGQNLYHSASFAKHGITLRFIAPQPLAYPQRNTGFIPSLSIIDTLMEVGRAGIHEHLESFETIVPRDVA